MINFIMLGQHVNRHLKLGAYASFVIVAVSNCINLSLLAASASHLRYASSLLETVVTSMQDPNFIQDGFGGCLVNLECPLFQIFKTAIGNVNQALRIQSGASICEGCSLSTILISCSFAGALCIRRFNAKNTDIRSTFGRRNNSVRKRIIGTVCAVFVAFLIRSCLAIILGLSRFNNQIVAPKLIRPPDEEPCENLCEACQGLGLVVQSWMMLTPEYSVTLLLLSSPLVISISLWAMTNPVMLQKPRADMRVPLALAVR